MLHEKGRMNLRKSLKISLPLLVFIFTGLPITPVMAAPVKLSWSPGWDVFTVTFNAFPASRLVYSAHSSEFKIDYVLRDANAPSTNHIVALDIFWPSVSNCIGFGTITRGHGSGGSTVFTGPLNAAGCEADTRQGVTRVVEGLFLGILALDSTGSGFLRVTIAGIPAGTYQVEFDIRASAIAPNFEVILQSPGPTFGDTVSVTIA